MNADKEMKKTGEGTGFNESHMQKLVDLCIAISAERDREALLSRILDTAMEFTNCDGGTLYLLEEDGMLHFTRMVTLSQNIRQGGHDDPITLPPVPMRETHVCARTALDKRLYNIPDVKAENTGFDFSGPKKYDEITGYDTRSMLVVPMEDSQAQIVGVLQLINAKSKETGETVPFDPVSEQMIMALTSQAAISIINMQYSEQIQELLDSLVAVLSTAIDARTPYNANHTRNMARYGGAFLDWLQEEGDGSWSFDSVRRRAFLLSTWLHDIGKLVVPLSVMDKESRLGTAMETVKTRFERMRLLNRIAELEGRKTPEEAAGFARALAEALETLEKDNRAGFLPDEELEKIQAIAGRTYTEEDGTKHPWLTPQELVSMSVRKGTLTADERVIMESHVVMTAKFLEEVRFPKEYGMVPAWAAAHHELLNGKGYPDHIGAEEIPKEVRLLTILDVFDALTAVDRPYKPGMPVEKAFFILEDMVKEGGIDGEILKLFKESCAWERAAEKKTEQ